MVGIIIETKKPREVVKKSAPVAWEIRTNWTALCQNWLPYQAAKFYGTPAARVNEIRPKMSPRFPNIQATR